MKTNPTKRQGFTLVELLVVITIIAALAALVSPQVLKALNKADVTTATNNARNIGLAMFNFQNDYGRFPDASTQEDIEENFPDAAIQASTSDANGYFRQLFIAGFTDSEEIFFAKTSTSTKPDGIFDTTNTCLERGENAFGYILNGQDGQTTGGSSSRYIVATPLASATSFDQDPFSGKAVALRIDQSVQSLNINDAGEALIGGGKKLLEAGQGTIWGSNITPTMVEPQ